MPLSAENSCGMPLLYGCKANSAQDHCHIKPFTFTQREPMYFTEILRVLIRMRQQCVVPSRGPEVGQAHTRVR